MYSSSNRTHTVLIVGLSIVYAVLLFLFSKDFPFFWDTVQLGSKHAHWYYENNYQSFFLPQSIDSGHPPTFGMYIALLWKILGKKLWVSHLSLVPFTALIVFYAWKIGDYFLGN